MTDYPSPSEAEGPEEIDPATLATDVKMELLLRNPESWTIDTDGKLKCVNYHEVCGECHTSKECRQSETHRTDDDCDHRVYSVDPKWLEWSGVPLVADPDNCGHGFSACADCSNDWGLDYFLRIFVMDGDWKMVWMSPDHPDNPFPEADDGPPIYNIT
jgi:hypothetical protein